MSGDRQSPAGQQGPLLQPTGQRSFSQTRHRVWLTVLNAARCGTLSVNWRDDMTFGARGFEDAEHEAMMEVVSSPVSPWEPCSAVGDWRNALNSWHAAQIYNENSFEVSEMEGLVNVAADLRSQLVRQDSQERRIVLRNALRRAEWHMSHRIHHVMRRDILGASYRAGLAAGGDDIDWLGWYRAQIEQWNVGSRQGYWIRVKESKLAELECPQDLIASFQRLPIYWTHRR